MRVNPKIRLQTPLLMLCIGVLAGCVTIEPLTDEEKRRFSKIAVVSTLGDIFVCVENPDAGPFRKSGEFSYDVDFNGVFEQAVIARLAGKVPFELEAVREMRKTEFMNNFFQGEPLFRSKKVGKLLRDSGYDGMIILLGHDLGMWDELGMWSSKKSRKDGMQLVVYSNFFLYLFDAEQEKFVFVDGGYRGEVADVQPGFWPSSAEALKPEIRAELIEQSVNVAVKRINSILDFQFFGISDE